ncbi:hypothetical protein [Amycolatopsis sp. PS_44_ISF1]|uniref:VG15 protein n=1 Tax=Amycolatopsis sp. PS_44_ISF1 TaxID=2974917 RepID=UPI0028DFF87E|nr:hypothetical protein [Amycolatopsis sp. PS_44_ISF1]MDT8910896.1 hypothetical protein [Amycolatopsis sp. PS_44_ISF1]
MAATTAGRAATTAHRLAQGRISARVVAEVLGLWRSLDPLRLTDPGWSAQVLAALARHREDSAALATRYYRDFRRAEAPAAAPLPPRPAPAGTSAPWRNRAATSLRVTGTRTVARLILGGLAPEAALDRAGPGVAAASSRHVLESGRAVVQTSLRADPAARGWLRVTDGDPCAFCAMLASRGAFGTPVLYRSERSATTTAATGEEYHDGCGCQAEPVFGRVVLPEASQRFAALWETSTEGLSGKAARNAFRRAHAAAHRG